MCYIIWCNFSCLLKLPYCQFIIQFFEYHPFSPQFRLINSPVTALPPLSVDGRCRQPSVTHDVITHLFSPCGYQASQGWRNTWLMLAILHILPSSMQAPSR